MTTQITDTDGAVIPYAPKGKRAESEADQLDRAGNAILALVNRVADTTEAERKEARDAAEKLADQLRAAHNQINELKAHVRYYQDRMNRAERWLHQISLEVEQRFLGANDGRSARRRVLSSQY